MYLYSTDYHAATQLEEYVLEVERMARTAKWCWVRTAQQNLSISTNFCCCQCHFL